MVDLSSWIILVIGSEQVVRHIKTLLKGFSGSVYQIKHSTRFSNALRRLKNTSFDLVLLDPAHAGLEGEQAVSRLLEASPEMPVIALLEDRDDRGALQLIRAGAQDCLFLPDLDASTLSLAVQKTVGRREFQQRYAPSAGKSFLNMDGALEALWEWNISEDRFFCSPGLCHMLGFEPEDRIHDIDSLLALVHPEDSKAVRETFKGFQSGQAPGSFGEFRLRAKSGRYRWVRNHFRVIREGAAVRLVGIFYDITENKASKRALTAREHQQSALVNLGRLAIETSDEQAVFDTAVQIAARGLRVQFGLISEAVAGEKDFLLRAGSGWEEGWMERASIPMNQQSLTGYTFLKGDPVIVEDFLEENRFKVAVPLQKNALRSSASVVIPGSGQPYGVLSVYSLKRRHFNKKDILFLQSIANTLSVFLQRQKADETLRRGEASFQEFFEAASEGIWFLNREFRIVYLNEQMAKMLGYTREELFERSRFDFSFEEDKPALQERMVERRQGVRQVFETRLIRRDGSTCWVLISATPVFSEKGDFLGSFGMLTDITVQKTTEDALRQSEKVGETRQAHLDSLFRAAPIGLGVVANRVFLDVNDAMCVMLGYSRQELIGQDMRFLYARPEEIDQPAENGAIEISSGGVITSEAQWRMKSGKVLDVILSWAPVDPGDAAAGYTIAVQDISRQKRDKTILDRRVKELTILHAIARMAIETASVDELAGKAVDIIGDKLSLDFVGILTLDEEERCLRLRGHYQGIRKNEPIEKIPLGVGITGRVAADGLSRFLPDVSKDPGYVAFDPRCRSEICVPIKVENHILGVLNVESVRLEAFSADDESLLATIAGQLASAIQRLILNDKLENSLKETTRSNLELTRLYQASEAILMPGQPDLKNTSQVIVETILKEFGKTNCSLLLLGPAGILNVMAAGGINEKSLFHGSLDLNGKGLIYLAARTGQVVNAPDVRKHPDYLDGWSEARSELVIPLKVGEKILGALDLQSADLDAFSQDDERLLSIFAQRAALILENQKMFEETSQRSREFQELYETSRDLAGEHDLQTLIEMVIRRATSLLGYAYGCFHRYNPEENLLEVIVNTNQNVPLGLHLKMGQGLAGVVAQTRQPLFVKDYRSCENRAQLTFEIEITSLIEVPLLSGGELLGVISLYELAPVIREYNEEEIRLLSLFAAQAAGEVQTIRLLDQTRRRIKELEAISRVSSVMRATETVEEMFPALLDETLAVFDLEVGAVMIFNPETGILDVRSSRGWLDGFFGSAINPGEGVIGGTFASGKTYVSTDLRNDPGFLDRFSSLVPNGWGTAIVPIKTSQSTVGVLMISAPSERHFSAEEVNLLQTLAEITGNAYHRTRLRQQTRLQLDRLSALNAINLAINSSFDLENNLSVLLRQLKTQLQVDAASILRYIPQTQTFEVIALAGFTSRAPAGKDWPEISSSLALQSLVNQQPMIIPDLTQIPNAEDFSETILKEGLISYHAVPMVIKGEAKGVLETFHRKPFKASAEWLDFLSTLGGVAAIAVDNSDLFNNLQQSNYELTRAYDETIEGWSRALDLRDHETEGHTRRVTEITLRLAASLGIDSSELTHIRRGALLHDIGKMGVPDQILNKPGILTDKEWEIMLRHPLLAFELLDSISYLRPALDIPYCHHEKWDGTGYPRRLKGEEIPLSARIFAVVDVWDALTSDRPYRPAWPPDQALAYISEQSGKHFDPRVVEVFLRNQSRVSIAERPGLLVIEKDPDALRKITRSLENRLQVAAALNFEETAFHLQKQAFDFVLMEQQPQDAPAVEFLKLIQSRQPSAVVFLMSRFSNQEIFSTASELGVAASWISKPLNPEELYERIIQASISKKLS